MSDITINRDIWDKAVEDICDNYCQMPNICATQERLNRHCAECPLDRLSKGKYPLGYCPEQE